MTPGNLVLAKRLWDYAASFRSAGPSELIVLCCSYDLRVCDHACALLCDGIADRLLISGNTGNWTRALWDRPEAEVFAERAIANGVDPARLILEKKATHFGENIAFARALAPDARSVIFVTKPNSALRVRLTQPVQWPGITAHVDGPDLAFPDQVSEVIGLQGVIEEMVGDIHRVLEYPAMGFQAGHDLPAAVLEAWQLLVAAGFTGHMLKHRRLPGVPRARAAPLA